LRNFILHVSISGNPDYTNWIHNFIYINKSNILRPNISYTLTILNNIKLATHDAFFLLDRLRSNKLLELYRTERRISSNLLDRKQSSKKKALCAANFNKFSENKLLYIIPVNYPFIKNKFKFVKIIQFFSNHNPPISLPTRIPICFLFNFLKINKFFLISKTFIYFYLPVSFIFYLPDFYLATRIPNYPYHFYVIFLSDILQLRP